jgi:hypothetical protein
MNIIGAEFRVLWIRRSWVGLAHLDSAERLGCRVVQANRLVEGEIVSLGPEGADGRREVVRSRIDPGYGPGPGYGLREYTLPEIDPALGPYFELIEPVSMDVQEQFYGRIDTFPSIRMQNQVRVCRKLIEEQPPFILPLHRLGEVEWLRGRREKALKYLWTGYRLGRAAIPVGFKGTIDNRNGANAPLFMVATDLIKALAHFGREAEALELMADLLRLDRPLTFDADGMLAPLLLRAGRIDELKHGFDKVRTLDEHEFVHALLLFEEGRVLDAVRAICRGMRANPLMLNGLVKRQDGGCEVPFREGPYGFGPDAELFTSLIASEWKRRDAFPFLLRVAAVPEFRLAWFRASAAARESDAVMPVQRSGDPKRVFRQCFSDRVTAAAVASFPGPAVAD